MTLESAERIDRLCDEFESAFNAGQRPQIDAYVKRALEGERPSLLTALVDLERELRTAAGERPQLDEYRARFPESASLIEAVWSDPNLSGRTRSSKVSSRIVQTLGTKSAETSVVPNPTGASSSEEIPRTLGRFEIVRLLGKGAFGAVYLARDPRLDRNVAVKVPQAGGFLDGNDRQRFLREARTAAGLSHPNICRVHEVDEVGGRDFIVMEYVEGRSLEQVMSQQKITAKQAAQLVRKLALALEEAHANGIVHRDVKPANVMINTRGEPVIMDFGLARVQRATDASLTQSGTIVGSPAYMSPEQARGALDQIGPPADIYSLGVVLYELLSGKRPFHGTITEVIGKILHVDAPRPSSHGTEIDSALEAVCMKAIAKDPKDRYASMKEFAAALGNLKEPAKSMAAPPKPVAPPATPAKPTPVLAKPGKDAAEQQRNIQQFVQQGQLRAALEALKPLVSNENEPLAAWAREQTAKIKADIKECLEQLPTLIALAQKLIRKSDYAEARNVLSQVPAGLRTEEVRALLRDAEEKQEECELLQAEIEDAIRRNAPQELPPRLKRFLQLRPGHKAMQKLADDLKQYGPDRALRVRKDRRAGYDPAGPVWNGKIIAGIIGGLAALVAGVYLAVVVFSTPQGTVVIEVHDKNVAVTFANDEVTLDSSGKKYTLKTTERKTLKVLVDGIAIESATQEITVSKNETKLITAKLVSGNQIELAVNSETKTFGVAEKKPQPPAVASQIAANPGGRGPRRVEIKELNLTGHDTFPWLSLDGKRMYFESRDPSPEFWVWFAERPDSESPFGKKRPLFPARQPALTGDELEMVFVRGMPGQGSFRAAQRKSIQEGFNLMGQIAELADVPNPKNPFLSTDGLMLVFQRGLDTQKSGEFSYCTRSDRTAPWSKPQTLPMTPDPSWTEPIIWPFLSNDGLTLWYCHGAGNLPEIRKATRTDRKSPFGNHQPVIVEQTPLLGRSPRFVESTGELFYAPNLTEAPRGGSLWVVKDYGTVQASAPSVPASTPSAGGWTDLFNGKDLSNWRTGDGKPADWKVENGYLEVLPIAAGLNLETLAARSLVTDRDSPLDFELHAEFWLPKEPQKNGEARGNSGIYLLGQYEIQICDSFENPIPDPTHACGAVYGVVPVTLNANLPPETWQTFDIRFQSPRVDGSEKVSAPGSVTVVLNGKTVVQTAPLSSAATGGAVNTRIGHPGPIQIQAHRSPVRYRNLRLRPLGPAPATPGAAAGIPADAVAFNGHSYKFFPEKISWKEAKQKCEQLGGHLPIVEDKAENDFLVKLCEGKFAKSDKLGGPTIWLGATDEAKEGDWRLIDGRPISFVNWYPLGGQPNNGGGKEHYATLLLVDLPQFEGKANAGGWSDQPDLPTQQDTYFVCEWDSVGP